MMIMFRRSTSIFKMIKSFIYVILLAVSNVHCNVTSTCGQGEICSSFLDIAMDMISKAKQNVPICNDCPKIERKPVDCADVLKMGHTMNGIYEIWPMNRIIEGESLKVYCDMDTDGGGWTVFQRRDFQSQKDYFLKDWKSYKQGFGNKDEEFWLGNDNIFALTNQKLYSARFDIKEVKKNKRFIVYDTFWIDDETHKYTLHVSDLTGDAEGESEDEENISDMSGDGDYEDYSLYQKIPERKYSVRESDSSLSVSSSNKQRHQIGDTMKLHDNQPFSTFDRDNDNHERSNCAKNFKGGWWYNNCHHANLNGFHQNVGYMYLTHYTTSWIKKVDESLEWTEIKIRPKDFRAVLS